jgi:hypothetical protein
MCHHGIDLLCLACTWLLPLLRWSQWPLRSPPTLFAWTHWYVLKLVMTSGLLFLACTWLLLLLRWSQRPLRSPPTLFAWSHWYMLVHVTDYCYCIQCWSALFGSMWLLPLLRWLQWLLRSPPTLIAWTYLLVCAATCHGFWSALSFWHARGSYCSCLGGHSGP